MAFFENLGQKLSKGGQDAIQKTKDMAEIVQLNSEINEDRKKLDKMQREVGSLVMTENFHDLPVDALRKSLRNDTSINKALVVSDWKALYERVIRYKEAEERIAGARERIAYLKGEEYCPNCGAQVASNAAFCPNCGTKLVRMEPTARNRAEDETAETSDAGAAEPAEEGIVEETAYTEVSESEASDTEVSGEASEEASEAASENESEVSYQEVPDADKADAADADKETDGQETAEEAPSETTAKEAEETVSEEPLQPDSVESGDTER